MAQYVLKVAPIIDAYQMTEASRIDTPGWPAWLTSAFSKAPGEDGAMFDHTHPGKTLLLIATKAGVITVAWNDWIIQNAAGEISTLSPSEFAAAYVPV